MLYNYNIQDIRRMLHLEVLAKKTNLPDIRRA